MSIRSQLRGEDNEIAGHLMRTEFRWSKESAPLPDVIASMDRAHVDDLPVIGEDGIMKGIVRRADVRDRPDGWTAGEVARHDIVPATYEEPVAEILRQMRAAHLSTLPVVAHGHVEGVVVLDDLARDPAHADTVAEVMHTGGRLARAASLFDDAFPVAATGAGLAVLTLGLLGVTYGSPNWLVWVDAAAALVGLLAAALYRTPEMLGVPLAGLLSAVMITISLFGWQTGLPAWATWLHLVAGLAFLFLTVGSGVAAATRPLPPAVPFRRRPLLRPVRWAG